MKTLTERNREGDAKRKLEAEETRKKNELRCKKRMEEIEGGIDNAWNEILPRLEKAADKGLITETWYKVDRCKITGYIYLQGIFEGIKKKCKEIDVNVKGKFDSCYTNEYDSDGCPSYNSTFVNYNAYLTFTWEG